MTLRRACVSEEEVEVLIVGGGLIGAILLLALTAAGVRCLLVDNRAFSLRLKADFDARSFALSSSSVRILNSLGLWTYLQAYATPIESVHVSEQGRFGSALLQADTSGPLGYVVESHDLNRVVYERLDQASLWMPATVTAFDLEKCEATIDTSETQRIVRANLIIAADGADSCMRKFCHLKAKEKRYPQQALIANIGLSRSHHHVAYERFTSSGPIALLPMTQSRAALVWCLEASEAADLQQGSEKFFLDALQRQFGYRLGRFVKVGKRTTYPLRQVIMQPQVHGQVVFIGNAAHTLHPVAGQGFNLGLRDVAMLAQYIVAAGSSLPKLQDYQAARYHDQMAITQFTHGLIELFTSTKKGIAFARSLGFMILDNNLTLKNSLSRYARGYAGVVSDLICGIPLGLVNHE